MGIKPNPLYSQGMGSSRCMPCINCRKDELREIALRFPEAFDVSTLVKIVQQAMQAQGLITLFRGSNVPSIRRAQFAICSSGIWKWPAFAGRGMVED